MVELVLRCLLVDYVGDPPIDPPLPLGRPMLGGSIHLHEGDLFTGEGLLVGEAPHPGAATREEGDSVGVGPHANRAHGHVIITHPPTQVTFRRKFLQICHSLLMPATGKWPRRRHCVDSIELELWCLNGLARCRGVCLNILCTSCACTL